MSVKWEYWTFRVRLSATRESATGKLIEDWVTHLGDGTRWESWKEILDNISDSGWEILSVVPETHEGSGETTTAYRMFCKRPAN